MTKARELAKLGEVMTNSQIGGRRNIIINGAMQVAQRGTSASVSDGSNEGYATVDRFKINFNSGAGGAVTASQSTDAPDGFSNSFKLDVTTANTFSVSGRRLGIQYFVEAQDLQHLNYGSSSAENITVSFYAKADNFSDKLYLSLGTEDGTLYYYFSEFTPTSSWQRFSITIPKATSATINNDNGLGLKLEWVLGATTSDGASSDLSDWTTTASRFKNDIGNILSSTDNNFYLTGVQLEVGSQATPFEHRSFGEELTLCQRYCHRINSNGSDDVQLGTGFYNGATAVRIFVPFPTTMRAIPTITTLDAGLDILRDSSSDTSINLGSAIDQSTHSCGLNITNCTSTTVGEGVILRLGFDSADNFFEIDAEL